MLSELSESSGFVPSVVIALDCGFANGRVVRHPVAVTASVKEAKGVVAVIIRAWNQERPEEERLALDSEDPDAVIEAYTAATRRQIQYISASYFTSARIAEIVFPPPRTHDPAFDEAPGDTLDGLEVDRSETVDTDA